ncbi:MAG: hypothetical protein COA42_03075 [Alteromonadaceae bacterium]|nr:MAG: hypothetical protein COA42_03075 [Alteromonadaceae bacterium]
MAVRSTSISGWSEYCASLFKAKLPEGASVHAVHSCIIDGIRHYVHAPELQNTDPSYFKKLCSFAKKNGARLKPDQRNYDQTHPNCRRAPLLSVLFLALGVNADVVYSETSDVTLNLISNDAHQHTASEHIEKTPENTYTYPLPQTDSRQAALIQQVLMDHYQAQSNDPKNLREDIAELAHYFAAYPEAQTLIKSLAKVDWSLKYAPHTYQTEVKGTQFSVDAVTVYFDPRSGAKLKFYNKCDVKKSFCIASPADALLHELLHVESILHDTDRFLADGGLGQQLYPHKHERETIERENVLYKQMTQHDDKPRPIRKEHSGQHVLVSCVTCLE